MCSSDLGEATKTIQFITFNQKSYSFFINWGKETDTCDKEGKVLRETNVRPNITEIKPTIEKHFSGNIDQIPPIFSAENIGGIWSILPEKCFSIVGFISVMLGLTFVSRRTLPSLSQVSVSFPQFIKNEYDFWLKVINCIVLVASPRSEEHTAELQSHS